MLRLPGPNKDMSYSLCRMGDVEQVPRQQSSARMGGRGTREWEGQGGWKCMLITSGAGGWALQVSVPQRTIHSGSGQAFPWPLVITDRFSQPTRATKHSSCMIQHSSRALNHNHSISVGNKYTGISLWVSLYIINVLYDSFADNYHSLRICE